jgi:hypothetical protein
VSADRGDDYSIEISVSILEIYNEQIHDLLVPSAKAKQKKYLTSVANESLLLTKI